MRDFISAWMVKSRAAIPFWKKETDPALKSTQEMWAKWPQSMPGRLGCFEPPRPFREDERFGRTG